MSQHKHREDDRVTEKDLLALAGAPDYSDKFVSWYTQNELLKHPPGFIASRKGVPSADNVKLLASAVAALAGLMVINEGFIPFSNYLGDDALLFGAQCLFAIGGFAAAYIPLDRTWCRPPFLWKTCQLEEDGTYYVGFKERRVPGFVRDLLRRIREFIPESTFEIKVLGPDPIVTCTTPRGTYTILIYEGDTTIYEP